MDILCLEVALASFVPFIENTSQPSVAICSQGYMKPVSITQSHLESLCLRENRENVKLDKISSLNTIR